MVKIAIPRAMSYYYLYPFYKSLLSDMGANVVLSNPTTKATMQKMHACPTDEPCIAVKLCFAHTQELIEGDYDYIFIPKTISVEPGTFCCPKFIGISDMIKSTFNEGGRILSPRIHVTAKKKMMEDLSQVAERLGVKKRKLSSIVYNAWQVQENSNRLMVEHHLTMEEAYDILDGRQKLEDFKFVEEAVCHQPTIGVIGHPYVLYEWISQGLVDRFRRYGKVITPEMVDKRFIKEQMNHIYEGHKLWSFEAQMLGAALYLMKNRLVDRIVLVGLFECGPESIIETYIELEADRAGIPLLKLFMDDQTGEAGLVTRIEAFMDTETGDLYVDPASSHLPEPKVVYSDSKPVIGFPSMGSIDMVMHSVLKEWGINVVKPPALSRRSLELGKELAPEFVCLPLTATLGQMVEMLEMGVDRFLMVGGKGICRLGWYAQVQELLLKRKGLNVDMIILDTPFPIRQNGMNFIKTLREITGGASLKKIIGSLRFAYHKLQKLDEAEEICRRLRAFEKHRGQGDKAFIQLKSRMEMTSDYHTVHKIHHEFMQQIQSIETEDTDPIRVYLVGEIWVLFEPYVNMEIEKFLGSRDGVRVWVEREHSVTQWFQGNILYTREAKERIKVIKSAAAPYLSEPVGGHGLDSVGLTVLASREGIDGVIHLMPFTCMPEIVAHNILTQVSDQLDIPILSLIISDQTGEAGMETRLEAFLDLLLERRFETKQRRSISL